MSTDIVQVDERPLSTVTIGNQVAHYHELTEAEVSTALHKLSRIEIAILNLAAGGMGGAFGNYATKNWLGGDEDE